MASTQKRKYELKARAERQQQTRARIVAATVALHEEAGPARTTIADIARRAGVQRITVYTAFPDTRDLFAACQRRFLDDNPQPDLAPKSAGEDPAAGLQGALTKLYAWYRGTEAMEHNVHHDRHLVPALDALMTETNDARLDALATSHARALAQDKASATRALIRLALEFHTWELFAHQGMTDRRIARLMVAAIECLPRGPRDR